MVMLAPRSEAVSAQNWTGLLVHAICVRFWPGSGTSRRCCSPRGSRRDRLPRPDRRWCCRSTRGRGRGRRPGDRLRRRGHSRSLPPPRSSGGVGGDHQLAAVLAAHGAHRPGRRGQGRAVTAARAAGPRLTAGRAVPGGGHSRGTRPTPCRRPRPPLRRPVRGLLRPRPWAGPWAGPARPWPVPPRSVDRTDPETRRSRTHSGRRRPANAPRTASALVSGG
jgi:hypothetical protein